MCNCERQLMLAVAVSHGQAALQGTGGSLRLRPCNSISPSARTNQMQSSGKASAMKLSRDCLWLFVIRPQGLSVSLCLRRCYRIGALATGDKKGLSMAVFIAYAAGNRERVWRLGVAKCKH